MVNLDSLYTQISEKERLNFLFELLQNDGSLREAFLRKYAPQFDAPQPENIAPKTSADGIDAIKSAVCQALANIDIHDYDPQDYYDPGYYKPDYEIMDEHVEEQYDRVLSLYLHTIKEELLGGLLTSAVETIIGVFYGCLQTEIADEYGCLDGNEPEEFFLNMLSALICEIDLEKRKYSPEDAKQCIQTAIRHYNPPESDYEADYLKTIEPILRRCIFSVEIANNAMELFQQNNFRIGLLPEAFEKIYITLQDDKALYKHYQGLFPGHYNLAVRYVKYLDAQNHPDLEKCACILSETYHSRVSALLMEMFEKGSKAYVEGIKAKVKSENQLDDYKELATYLADDEHISFVHSLYNNVFKAEIMALNQWYDDIIALLNDLYGTDDFSQIVILLKDSRPEEAFECIKKHIGKYYSETGSRSHYSRMARLFKAAMQLNMAKADIVRLILEKYNSKPNKPALKDEFRQEGIVNEEGKVVL